MPLKLHYNKVSQPSRAVAWFIRTHNLPVEFVDVDFLKGETFTPEFTAKNPFQAVPVLELEDGSFMNESGAILFYLAKKFNVKGEIPETLEGEAKVLSAALNHADLSRNVTKSFVLASLPKLQNPALTWEDVTKSIAEKQAELVWAFNILEAKLGAHAYVAGDAWTLADYNVAAEVSQWSAFNGVLPVELKLTAFPNVQKYVERVSQRAGWADFVAPFHFLVGLLQLPQ